ncbi:hypothetical protein [Streptomyces sp. NBC_01483]|uniref:hypothetical protein n=1 Tax=Streptomyces sp. NBC_01483 TaxID=2903883 RepID=UPI002E37F3B3|nr:hypothetical protein [Streptomyces sp. NBC_01483]
MAVDTSRLARPSEAHEAPVIGVWGSTRPGVDRGLPGPGDITGLRAALAELDRRFNAVIVTDSSDRAF